MTESRTEFKTIRIKDIAAKANVSTGTVDRVLHDRGRVADKVKKRVLKIIQELEYQPNVMARALGNNKTFIIAALLPDTSKRPCLDTHKAGVIEAAGELNSNGVHLKKYFFDPDDLNGFSEQAKKLTEDAPDGILLPPDFNQQALPFLDKWKKNGIPFVIYNADLPEGQSLCSIGQDFYRGGLLAGRLAHMVSPTPGTIVIAQLNGLDANAPGLLEKEKGFRNYFLHSDQNMYSITNAAIDISSQLEMNQSLDDLFQTTPDTLSIFVSTSGAYHLAKYMDVRSIKHIKIIGFDLLPQNLHYLNSGAISFLINTNRKMQGRLGIFYLADHLVFRREVPELKHVPFDIVAKENASYYFG